jgi:IS30 family transposase
MSTGWWYSIFYKGMDVTKLTESDVLRVEGLLNNRPRRALDYHSPVRSSLSS